MEYGVQLPSDQSLRTKPEALRVLFVGRGSKEKRIPLAAKIASKTQEVDQSIRFRFAGPVANFIPAFYQKNCDLMGTIGDKEQLNLVYRDHQALLLTSQTESGPLVVLEAMSNGLVILATPVGIVPGLRDVGMQGLVFSTINDEDQIVNEAVQFLLHLREQPDLLQKMQNQNMRLVQEHFSVNLFQQRYKSVLLQTRNSR
ncbi:MAG: glycosyltransferase family 1 protein [Sphingobacteriales bacterium]|nr:MAG: glycosyltransferase family 1 protein [Sphingobacteriales bacterium]